MILWPVSTFLINHLHQLHAVFRVFTFLEIPVLFSSLTQKFQLAALRFYLQKRNNPSSELCGGADSKVWTQEDEPNRAGHMSVKKLSPWQRCHSEVVKQSVF